MKTFISDFRRWAREHPNFMTPHILKLSQRGNFIIELSEGSGFDHKPIYGVTVIEHINNDFKTDTREYGKMFFTMQEAEDYFITLKGMV